MTKFFKAIILTTILSLGIYGAVRAFLFDMEQSHGNRVQASSINLRVGDSDPSTFSFAFSNLIPGETQEATTTLSNDGSLDGNFWFDVSVSNSSEGENFESETNVQGEGDLENCAEMKVSFIDQSLNETVVIDYTQVASINDEIDKANSQSTLDQMVNNDQATMKIYMRADSCTNDIIGDYFDLNFDFYLDQI